MAFIRILLVGVHPNTLRKWAKEGKIKYIKSASGQKRYDVNNYLGIQQEAKIIKDIGSGINFKRKGLFSILESAINGDKLKIVVAYGDRLARFGIDLIKWVVERNGGELVVLKQIDLSTEQELISDLLTIFHVFNFVFITSKSGHPV